MNSTRTLEHPVAKAPKKPDPIPEPTKQIAFRAPLSLAARMEKTAAQLGLDPSNFLRMMLLECLPTYEERGERIAKGGDA